MEEPRRTREEVFAWAAAEAEAGRRPGYKAMARYGVRSTSTISTWVKDYGDPRGAAPNTPANTQRTPPNTSGCSLPISPPSSGCTLPEPATEHPVFATLTPQQSAALWLKLDGLLHVQIATRLGVNRHTIGEWFTDPIVDGIYQAEKARQHTAMQDALTLNAQKAQRLHGKALDKLEVAIDEATAPEDIARLARAATAAAKAQWSHGGYPRTERQEVTTEAKTEPRPHQHRTAEDIRAELKLLQGGKPA